MVGISSKFLHIISTCICIRKNYKNGEFFTFHFWRNLAKDPVLVQGFWSDFGATLKIHKKSKIGWNQLKVSTYHKYMYMYQENYKNGEFSQFNFW